mmetsp:Transcript_74401/g.205343  ORF Transcript_74401/g.205343 Transcript_74401/m.205343 type:complete len:330 (-) Transcript_74401:3045-4034(-)
MLVAVFDPDRRRQRDLRRKALAVLHFLGEFRSDVEGHRRLRQGGVAGLVDHALLAVPRAEDDPCREVRAEQVEKGEPILFIQLVDFVHHMLEFGTRRRRAACEALLTRTPVLHLCNVLHALCTRHVHSLLVLGVALLKLPVLIRQGEGDGAKRDLLQSQGVQVPFRLELVVVLGLDLLRVEVCVAEGVHSPLHGPTIRHLKYGLRQATSPVLVVVPEIQDAREVVPHALGLHVGPLVASRLPRHLLLVIVVHLTAHQREDALRPSTHHHGADLAVGVHARVPGVIVIPRFDGRRLAMKVIFLVDCGEARNALHLGANLDVASIVAEIRV